MSNHSGRTNYIPPRDEREQYIRDNAVAIVDELEGKIIRLRKQINLNLAAKKSLRKQLELERKTDMDRLTMIDALFTQLGRYLNELSQAKKDLSDMQQATFDQNLKINKLVASIQNTQGQIAELAEASIASLPPQCPKETLE